MLVGVEGDLEYIISIGGKVVFNRHAAARSKRCTCNAARLRDDSGNHGGCHHRHSLWIAYCRAADFARSGNVRLKQGRRHRKHVGHVIKAVAHVVGRQQIHGIHIQTKQRIDRVGILQPIQPVQRREARIRVRRCDPVQTCFQACCQRVRLRIGRSLTTRRRHHARAQLADDLLRFFRVLFRMHKVEALQRKPAAMHVVAVARNAVIVDGRRGAERARRLWSLGRAGNGR